MPNPAHRTRLPAIWSVLALLLIVLLGAFWQIDSRVARLWLTSAELAGTTCLIALPLGTLLASVIFKTDAPGRRFAALLLIGMLFVPLYVVTGALDAGFGVQGWHTLSTNMHLSHEPWLTGWRATVWVHSLAAVPWVVLIVGTSLRGVEAEIEEDAETCAAPRHVMWYISIRRALPAIVMAGVWIAVITTTEISVTDFFQVRTFAEEVYTQSALGTFDASGNPLVAAPTSAIPLPALTAMGLWSGLVLSTCLAIAAIAGSRRLMIDLADSTHRSPWVWRLRTWRWPVAILLGAIMLVLVALPIGSLFYKAGIVVTVTDDVRTRSWSIVECAARLAAAPFNFRGEFLLSGEIGSAAATAALAIAIPLAWGMRPRSGVTPEAHALRVPWLRLLALALCLTIPGPLLGVAVIRVLNQPPDSPLAVFAALYDSTFAPWLVQTIRAIPLATLIMWPALATVPQAMLDAAATDGTGWWGRLFRIALPQRWPAVLAAWLIGFAVAVGELAATILVMPPVRGATALSIKIFQELHNGVDFRVAAVCLAMVFTIAALTGISAALLKRRI